METEVKVAPMPAVAIPRIQQYLVTLASDPWVGKTWTNGNQLKRTVDSQATLRGEPVYLISTEGERSQDIVRPAEIEALIARETHMGEANKKFRADQAAQQSKRDAAEATRVDLDGFEKQFDAKNRARVVKALTDGGINVKGRFFSSRRDAIRHLIEKGYTVQHWNSGRKFVAPDETFFDERPFTKIGLDYAQYLLNKRT